MQKRELVYGQLDWIYSQKGARSRAYLRKMENQTLALAPAAGHGIGKLVVENLLDRPGFVEKMGDVIWNALEAERRVWDKEANGGKGGWVCEPDSRSQLQAFFGIIAHMEGEPIKRIVHQHLGGNGETADPLAALKDSPALREAVRRTLDKSEFKGRHSKVKQAEPVFEVD